MTCALKMKTEFKTLTSASLRDLCFKNETKVFDLVK